MQGNGEPITNRKIDVAPAGLDAFTSALNDCRLISPAAAAITKQHFYLFFWSAAPSQKSSVILGSLRNWMYCRRSEKHDYCNLRCSNIIPSPLMFIRRHHHFNHPPPSNFSLWFPLMHQRDVMKLKMWEDAFSYLLVRTPWVTCSFLLDSNLLGFTQF